MRSSRVVVNDATLSAARAKARQAEASARMLRLGLGVYVVTIISAASGLVVLHLLTEEPHWDGVPLWVDAFITGVIFGGGTVVGFYRWRESVERGRDPGMDDTS